MVNKGTYSKEWYNKKKEDPEWRKKRNEYQNRRVRTRRKEDPEFRERNIKNQRKRRFSQYIKAVKIYGSKCQECSNEDIRLFQFHHKYGKSGKGKREHTHAVISRIIRKGKQVDIELLCANCHILADLRDGTYIRVKLGVE